MYALLYVNYISVKLGRNELYFRLNEVVLYNNIYFILLSAFFFFFCFNSCHVPPLSLPSISLGLVSLSLPLFFMVISQVFNLVFLLSYGSLLPALLPVLQLLIEAPHLLEGLPSYCPLNTFCLDPFLYVFPPAPFFFHR